MLKVTAGRWTLFLGTSMKKCNNCRELKPLKEFTQSKRVPSGYTTICKVCTCTRQYEWREHNRDKTRSAVRRYNEKHKDRVLAKCALYRATSPQYKITTKNNNDKRTKSGYKKAWTATHRANKIKATPKWANLEKIKHIYKGCPKGWHVDHVIPLRGRNVCGLHVETNLQYLPAHDNMSKSNKFN